MADRTCLDCGEPVKLSSRGGRHLDVRLDDTHTPHVVRYQTATADEILRALREDPDVTTEDMKFFEDMFSR